jgi:hypothetical protein
MGITYIDAIWLWEQGDGESRLLSKEINKLKDYIETIYDWDVNSKVTYHLLGDSLIYVHYQDREVGFIKLIGVI